MIKFYIEELSNTAQLWYQNITPFLLSQHVMPNIDIPIELSHADLKYDSRFVKYIKNINKNHISRIQYVSRPYIGKTLHN